MMLGKPGRIRNEAVGFGPTAIETEVVNLLHADAPLTGSKMLLGLAPGLKCRSIQVGVLGRSVLEESV
jgi:hypothetical protein